MALPTPEAADIANQLRRAGGSTGAHYRASKRNRSDADYINKISGAIEEADESVFWMEVLRRGGIARAEDAAPLVEEAEELISIFVSSRTTAIERRRAKRKRPPKPKASPGRSTEHHVRDDY